MGMGLWEHQPAENNRQKDTSEEQEIATHRTDDFKKKERNESFN
jgi:hypothetical protein